MVRKPYKGSFIIFFLFVINNCCKATQMCMQTAGVFVAKQMMLTAKINGFLHLARYSVFPLKVA